MGNSPKLDSWLEKKPDSWVKKVESGIFSLEGFKEGFKKSMKEIGKEEVLDYMSAQQYERLYEAYNRRGIQIPPEAQAEALQPQRTLTQAPKVRQVQAREYSRRGRVIKGYKAVRSNWNDGQSRFIKNRFTQKDNKKLMQEFNTAFGTNRSIYSIRDRKLRLRGTKKK